MPDTSAVLTHEIIIAAAAIVNANGEMLVVRKRGTTAFMQPGGKLDAGETPENCLLRELEEELGLIAPKQALKPMEVFSAPAANEPDTIVTAHMFLIDGEEFSDIEARAEIEQITWVDVRSLPALELAPLTRDRVVPAVLRQSFGVS